MQKENYFINRRTVRNFSSRTVSPELLKEMLSEAAHAPNTGNMQIYSVIVTSDPEAKKRLAVHHFNQPASTGCQVLLTFCADIHRFNEWCRLNNADAGFDNLQMFLAATIDASIFAQQFNTIAEMNGLGCCYLGTTAYNAPAIAKELNLPDGVVPVISLAVGYPENGKDASSSRLPLEAVVHLEKYHDFSDNEIKEIYSALEAEPASKKFVEENDKQNLAQVFAEVRYPRSTNELFSKSLRDYLDTAFFKKQ